MDREPVAPWQEFDGVVTAQLPLYHRGIRIRTELTALDPGGHPVVRCLIDPDDGRTEHCKRLV